MEVFLIAVIVATVLLIFSAFAAVFLVLLQAQKTWNAAGAALEDAKRLREEKAPGRKAGVEP